MNRNLLFLFFILIALFLSSCSSTLILSENEYLLTRNTTTIDDSKVNDYVSLDNYLYPVPNKRFMDLFPIKTSLYANYQIKKQTNIDSLYQYRPARKKIHNYINDNFSIYINQIQRFQKWLGEEIGEPPILLDTNEISRSIEQVKGALNNIGYFDAVVTPEIVYAPNGIKKAQVIYHVKANAPYYIRKIEYDIDIPEYKKIIVLNEKYQLITPGTIYNAELISSELNRVIDLIRNRGYYYINKSIIYCQVDTIHSKTMLNKNGNPTLALKIIIELPQDSTAKNQYLQKFKFDKVFIYTNYQSSFESGIKMDTISFTNRRARNDSTFYYFITPNYLRKDPTTIYRDYHYRTIAEAIFTKKNLFYSQELLSSSKKRLNDLKNFSYININYVEDKASYDSVHNIGVLNSVYKLTRRKVHSIGGQLDLRTDKARASFNYSNKNILRGAEYLSINLYGGYVYYSLYNKRYVGMNYPEAGGRISIDFPRLFLLKKVKIKAIKYSTSIRFGIDYSGLYNQFMYNTGITYNWNPNNFINEVFSPIDISTITTYDKHIGSVSDSTLEYYGTNYFDITRYPLSYRSKFENFFLLSLKYNLNYVFPLKNKRENMRFSLFYESTGMALKGIDELINFDKIGKYRYTTYQNIEIVLQHYYTINSNNSTALRVDVGAAVPLFNDGNSKSVIPFERGFFLGGSNSMRAWTYRSIAPGSYTGSDSLQYSGDLKLELNFEYRGTIYKAFKYGLFTDIGKIWLTQKHDDMPNAEINRSNWFMPAICVGAGIRLDFNFFIIRLDYAVPILNPSMDKDEYGIFLNKRWIAPDEMNHKKWRWGEGFKFAIGHAF